MSTKITIVVERASDGGFSAFMEEDAEGFGLAGYGDTAREAVSDLFDSYEEIKEIRAKEGKETSDIF